MVRSLTPDRREHLLRFRRLTVELQAAMKRRGRESPAERNRLAQEVGVTPETVWGYSTGRIIPSMTAVARLADALSWGRLVTLSEELRTKACVVCDQPFLDSTHDLKRVACNEAHKRTHATRQRRGSRAEALTITSRMLERHRQAVGAFCRACSDSGICPDRSCELRPVSPLPLKAGEQWAEVIARAPWTSSRPREASGGQT
jgi:hypothetical protein